jgi:hypothetical protein
VSGKISARAWKHDGIFQRHFLTEETRAPRKPARGTISLNADQLDEIGDSLKARAELLRRTSPGAVA